MQRPVLGEGISPDVTPDSIRSVPVIV